MMRFAVACLAAGAAPGFVAAAGSSPIGKVIQMISDLQAKVLSEGEDAQKVYAEFSEFCEDRARDLAHDIKNGNSEVERLKAAIAESSAINQELTAKIDGLASAIATDEADLKAATDIRTKEAADFHAEESELMSTSDMLTRAVGILEREAAKGSPSMLQVQNAQSLAAALAVMVDASMMNSADMQRLTALVQTASGEQSAADDEDPGAPAAAAYESKSGGIVETLRDLLEKAEKQLDEARKTETKNLQAFEMLQQSLNDEIRFANKDLEEAKKGLSQANEAKAIAEGDLAETSKDLQADLTARADLHQQCMSRASDFEAETSSRGEELAALAKAKQVITEATGGAEAVAYSAASASFVQTAARSSDASIQVAHAVRDLARKHGDQALALLAQRLFAVARSGVADPFGKVKGMITEMVARLEAEAEADAKHKTYCDKELKETNAKKDDKSVDVEELSTKIDQMKATSASLKEEVAALQKALSNIASSQAEADKLRATEKEAYTKNKAELEQGLQGVQVALKVLNDYYSKDSAHGSASGSSTGIIGLLQVVESDFSKNLAEIVSAEEAAAAAYEQETKDSELERTAKEKDVEYKTKESARLETESAALSTDRDNVQAELDAVLEYLAKIQGECTAKAETYEEKTARRDAELAGLKQALDVLESETALVQRQTVHRRFRGKAVGTLAA